MTVLIIDDDPNYTYLVEQALNGIADTILKAQSWKDAAPLIEQKPEVAWIDLCIPPDGVHDSIEHIRVLREKRVEMIIVISSGYVEPYVAKELNDLHVDAIMSKGGRFEPGQVAALVVLGMMRSADRGLRPDKEWLSHALQIMKRRFPTILIPSSQ